MSIKPVRPAPIDPAAWDDDILDGLGAFPKSLQFVLNDWNGGEKVARGQYALGVWAHHPVLAKAFMTLNAHVASASTLDVRVRELLILRAAWLRKSEYEFQQHVILGKRAGLTDAELEWLKQGSSAAGWPVADALIVKVAEDLCYHARISDAVWAELVPHYSTQQIMDMIGLFGCYDLLGMMIGCFDTPLEPELPAFDDATRARMMAGSCS